MSISFETLALAKRYTNSAVADAIGGVTSIDFRFVESLPWAGDSGVIYCVPSGGSEPDLYDEYYYVNGRFERIPGATIDLTTYATKDWVNNEGYYKKPADGIPETDLDDDTRAAIAKAETALQEHQSLAAYRTAQAQDEIDNTLANIKEIEVGDTEPTDPNVKLWMYQNPGQKIEIPTMEDFRNLKPATDEQVSEAVSDWLEENISGGETIAVDKSLAIEGAAADAKVVGDLKSTFSLLSATASLNKVNLWERVVIADGSGSSTDIGTTGKRFEASTTRISIKPLINIDEYSSTTIKPDDGYKYYLFTFDPELTTIVIDSGWQTEEQTYELQKGYMSICFAHTSNAVINTTDWLHLEINAVDKTGRIVNLENKINNLNATDIEANAFATLFNSPLYFGNYTNGDGGANNLIKYESNATRIATYPPVNVQGINRVHIKPNDGYKYVLYTSQDGTTLYPSYNIQAIWQTDEKDVQFPDGTNYVILVIAKTDNSTISTDVYNKVSVTKDESLDKVIDDIYEKLDDAMVLPTYWKRYLTNKTNALKQADIDLGYNGVSFAFITDVHVNTNNMVSPKLLNYITRHTNVKEVVFGGDLITNYSTKDAATTELNKWMQETSSLNIVNLHGNHDNNSNNQTDQTQVVTDATFYALECRQSEDFVKFESNALYGYRDNEHQKVRFIYLDTGAPDSAVISDAQITWMQSKIAELENGWTVIVFAHQFWTGTNKTTPTLTIDTCGTKIMNGLDAIYDSIDATIACVIVGHCHRDYSMTSVKGYPIIATTCDASGTNASTYDPDQPTRTTGTTTEQCFDLYYINTSAKTINTIRIGAGDTTQDRTFSY